MILFAVVSASSASGQAQGYAEAEYQVAQADRGRAGGPRTRDRNTASKAEIDHFHFGEATSAAPIPNSRGAALCALNSVDDDTQVGWCSVFFDQASGQWMHQTGGGPTENQCEAVCLWIDNSDIIEELAATRRELRQLRRMLRRSEDDLDEPRFPR
jgi:hypothetical protein